jgi:hypothetical protein
MEIYLDGARQLTLQSDIRTVGAALVELHAWLQRNGRALQHVSIDGRDIPAEELTLEIGNLPASGVTRLDVTSASVADLVRDALDEVENVLPELPVACQSLAQILAGENPDEGLDSLTQILGIWMALRERRVQIAGAMGFDLAAVDLTGQTLADRDRSLGELLARIQEELDRRNLPALSDLIAYDLFEFAEQEPKVFTALRAKCTG